ncbi:MAG: ferric reductase domain protein transmembrane component protein [uncultured bacterium]|nr:MAG: ferric reductase domain protein transmembrane component protein [uncultured bacterium]
MKKILSTFVFSVLFFIGGFVQAQENPVALEYGDQPIVDMDLDGLTDLGEQQIFKTDPANADTDGNGLEDGAEVLGLSATNAQQIELAPIEVEMETPWAWYISRMTALVGFLMLYISILLGVSIRIPFMNKIFTPLYSLKTHCWISLQATILALIHGGSLMFDKFIGFTWKDSFVPFASSFEPFLVALGIISFYLMLILAVTSYGKKYINHKVWRILHSFNIFIYVFSIIHALRLGTDLKIEIFRNIFIGLNVFLAILFIVNIIFHISIFVKRRKTVNI